MAAPNASPGKGRPPGVRGGGGWRASLGLTVPSFCWEFLRRNPDYRADYQRKIEVGQRLDLRWGLSAPADPDLGADEAGVVWRADVAPGLVVPLERASFGRPRALPAILHEPVEGEDGRHIRLPSGLQMQLRGEASPAGPLLVVLAYDADFNLRVRAVDALRRASLTSAPPKSRLSQAQRERLARCLFALDGALSGRSHRQIAADLFGEAAAGDAAFATSSVRDVTARLVRRGRALMGGGYLQLLRAGF